MPDVKRLFDLLGACVLLVTLSPLCALVGVAIAFSSPGPVIFRQKRVGMGGRVFSVFKFRSMVADARRLGSWFTPENDPRVTSMGRLLRRTSLDELPQLVNVLLGDMSLVGPRPDVPDQMSLYTQEEREFRHRVRPGMTGWAQVTFRHEATIEERKAYDLRYVREQGLLLDIELLWLTLRYLMTGRRATVRSRRVPRA